MSPRPVLAVCISRGLAPVASVTHQARWAIMFGCILADPITGYPLVEGKNLAVDLAMKQEADLIMMEDDIIAPPRVWQETLTATGVTYASCRGRNGKSNIGEMGGYFFTGNVFTKIPFDVLEMLQKPIFRDVMYNGAGIKVAESNKGKGSDVYFWRQVQNHDIEIIHTGEVTHLRHSLNEVRDNESPCVITEW